MTDELPLDLHARVVDALRRKTDEMMHVPTEVQEATTEYWANNREDYVRLEKRNAELGVLEYSEEVSREFRANEQKMRHYVSFAPSRIWLQELRDRQTALLQEYTDMVGKLVVKRLEEVDELKGELHKA